MGMTRDEIARLIDHTLLRPEATAEQIRALFAEGRANRFANVCVNPAWVPLARSEVEGTGTGVCTVVDFPLGAGGKALKREAARRAVAEGADELDMVMAIGRLREGDDETVCDEIAAVVEAVGGRVVKVILETAILSPGEIDRACRVALRAGAAFVKTSTGLGPGGATVEAVRLLRAAVGDAMGVKAAGGIRDAATARAMIEAGADRLGTSTSLAILEGWEKR
jgi:deoxyribose-phosphate aldolase